MGSIMRIYTCQSRDSVGKHLTRCKNRSKRQACGGDFITKTCHSLCARMPVTRTTLAFA